MSPNPEMDPGDEESSGGNRVPPDPEGEEEVMNEEDIQDVIDLDSGQPEDEMAADLDDMELEGAEAEDVREDADVVFTKHAGSVFCVNVDSHTCSLAISGGEDDRAFVWKVASGDVILECTGHKDSVTCACFNYNSTLVATGDMGGQLKVWNIETKKEIWSFEVSDLEWIEWHSAAPVLVAGTSDGDMWMWKIPSGDCKTFQSHGQPCNMGRIMPDGKRVCSGYEDGTVKVWDLKAATVIHTFTGRDGHSGSITSISCHHDNNLIITGSTDMTAKLMGCQNGKVLATFDCTNPNKAEGQDDSVEAVAFSKVGNFVATGTLTGLLSLWDVSSQTLRFQCKHEAGIVRVCWDSAAPLVYTCALDGVVRKWDARTGKLEAEWTGHTEEILDLSLARDGSCIVTGGGDNTARVFNLHAPDR